MPRRNYRRRRTPRRGTVARTSGLPKMDRRFTSYAQTAMTAFKLAKWAASMINAEYKILDSINAGNVTDSASIACYNPLSQGTSATTRNGNTVKFTSVYAKGSITWNPTAGATSVQNVRAVWLIDKAPNGQLPAWTDVFSTTDVYSLRTPYIDKDRFIILKDQRFMVNAQRPQLKYSFYSPKNFHTTYLSNLGTIADIQKNSLILLLLGDQATANYPGINWTVRIKYVDN